jgi:hypothetical protein
VFEAAEECVKTEGLHTRRKLPPPAARSKARSAAGDYGLDERGPVGVGVAVDNTCPRILEGYERDPGLGDGFGERHRRERRQPLRLGATHTGAGQQHDCYDQKKRRGHAEASRPCRASQDLAFASEARVETPAKVGGRFDGCGRTQRADAALNSVIVPATGGALRQMAGETAKLARGRNEPVAKLRVSIEELVAGHRELAC